MINEEYKTKCVQAVMLLDFTVKAAKDHNEPTIDLITLERILEGVHEGLDKR